jgi:transketolase
VLLDAEGAPEVIVLATGSEVAIAVEAARKLNGEGRRVRVVSLPSVEVFEAQDAAWRESVLPAKVTRRIAIEAGSTGLWWKHVGSGGRVLGIDTFGASGKAADLFEHFGLTAAKLGQAIREMLDSPTNG